VLKFVPQLINLLAAGILMLSFAMISQRRIASLINLFALQGAALVAASVLLGYAADNQDLYVSAALTMVLKVILIPLLLYRVIRKLKVRWDVEPLINVPTLMIPGIAPVILHPILLKRFYPYLDDDASGHYQVGRGYAKRGKKPDQLGYFEPWNQQRFDYSEPYIARVQWRDAYKSYRANQTHYAHNVGV